MKRQPKRKFLAALLAAALLLGQTFPAMAVTNDEGPPCENHQQHDADCGYVEGSPCGHAEHTADCYTDELICGFDEDAVQTATDSEADKSHEHTQECYALDCPHERGDHSDACGYGEARPCTHECELCATKDSGTPPDTSGQNVQKSTPSEAAPAMVAAPAPNSTIIGNGYSFNPDDGKLTVSSNYGTTAWRNDSIIDKTAVTAVVVTDKVNTIGMSAFEGCTNIAQMELPDSVTSIGDRAFYGYVNLALTSLPDNLTSIGEYAFFDCSNLALTALPDSLTSIGAGAFSGCSKLALTALPASVTSIGNESFSGCSNLALTALPASVTSIGNESFSGCSNLALNALPDNLTSIGVGAFSGCSNLELKVLPDKLTSIGDRAFSSCVKLALTSLPDKLTSIGNEAFVYCRKLALTTLPASVTSIGNKAFSGCNNLALTSLPDKLTSIGEYAFSGCSNLALNALPDNLTSIGNSAFKNCTSLALTKLPDNLTSIGNSTFSGCNNLALTSLPNKLTSIGIDAFKGCTSLESLDLSRCTSLTSIGHGAFSGCTGLESLDLSGCTSLTSIGHVAFTGCSGLESLDLSGCTKLNQIGANAFEGCTSLTSLILSNTPAPQLGSNNVFNNTAPGLVIFVPKDASGYTSDNNWPGDKVVDGAALSGLEVGGGTLDPAFFPGTNAYTVSIPYTVENVTFTPTAHASGAITVNEIAVTSGSPSAEIPLALGETKNIPIVVKNSNTDSRTYTISVTRGPLTVISIAAIPGVTPPTRGAAPVNSITETAEYTGTVKWNPDPGATFAADTEYTATITLSPKPGYTLQGVAANFFKVNGATSVSNAENSGMITVKFPRTSINPVYSIRANTAALDFGTITVNDVPPTEKTVTVENTGNQSVTLTQPTATSYDVGVLSKTTLAPGETATFTVRPQAGLFVGSYSRTLTITPDQGAAVEVELFFTVTDKPTYTMTVTGGTGGGSYEAGAAVTITATVPSGKRFSGWTITPDVAFTSGGTNTETATFTMPAGAVTATANFEEISTPPTTYSVKVNGGTGGGSYEAGAAVTITATVPSDKRFSGWTITPDVAFTSGGTNTETATFTMPAGAVTATANFENKQSSGGGGGGGGSDNDIPSPTEQTVSKVEKAKPGDTVKVDLPSNGKLPSEILEAAAGKDITLEIDAGKGVTWIIKGKDIPKSKLSDLNLKVDAKASTIPVTVINAVTGEKKVMQLALSHNGPFGFSLTLRLETGKENAGLFANLYYYNEAAKALEYQSTAKIGADGNADLPFAHASSYAVIIDAVSHAPANPFADVKESDWYYNAVLYAYQNGLMNGTTSTTFDPLGAVTRAQPPVVLYRLEGSPAVTAQNPFADVRPGLWYANGITWAAGAGLVDGYNATTYGPGDAVTREQLAVMLWRYAKYKGWDVSMGEDTNILSYADAFDVSEWAIPALQWACGAGIMTGNTDNRLAPKAGATRAELAQMLQRLMEKYQQPAAPVNPSTGASKARRVRVQKGDTLSGLARKYNSTVTAIVQANSIIKNPSLILPGWELDIP